MDAQQLRDSGIRGRGYAPLDHLRLSIKSNTGNPWAKLGLPQRKPLASDPGADSIISMARIWLENCSKNHPDCSLPPLPGRTLPRRLLDLSSAGTQKIRIWKPHQLSPMS